MSFTKITLELHNAAQAHADIMDLWKTVLKNWLLNGHGLVLEVYSAKTRAQERLVHSCFRDMARDCPMAGQQVDAETWKRVLLLAFYEETRTWPDLADDWKGREPRMVPRLKGSGFVEVGIESRGFTKRLYSAFIEFVHATGAERGVRWSRTSLGRDVPDEVAA